MRGEPKDAPDSPSDRRPAPGATDRRYPRQRRLAGQALFDRAFKLGRRRTGKYFSMHWVDAVDQLGRLGLVISKRLTKTGVARNDVKRLVREGYRHSPAMDRPLHVVVRLRTMYSEGERMAARLELMSLLESVR
jgi:ribonuclease P protein component